MGDHRPPLGGGLWDKLGHLMYVLRYSKWTWSIAMQSAIWTWELTEFKSYAAESEPDHCNWVDWVAWLCWFPHYLGILDAISASQNLPPQNRWRTKKFLTQFGWSIGSNGCALLHMDCCINASSRRDLIGWSIAVCKHWRSSHETTSVRFKSTCVAL